MTRYVRWPLLLVVLFPLHLLGAQPAQTAGVPVTRRALSELLADASKRNALPAGLIAFKSRVDTEISTLLRREEGTEVVTAVEQVASTLRWTRSGQYDQHVIGYRSLQSGPNISSLSWFQTGWLSPTLYGNCLRIRTRNSRMSSVRKDGADTMPAVHPLADDRDRYHLAVRGYPLIHDKDRCIAGCFR